MGQSGPERTERSPSSGGEWWGPAAGQQVKWWNCEPLNHLTLPRQKTLLPAAPLPNLPFFFSSKSFPFLMFPLSLWLSSPPSSIAPRALAIKAFTACAEAAILQMASVFYPSWYDARVAPAADAQMKNPDDLQEKSVCHLFGDLKVVTGRQETRAQSFRRWCYGSSKYWRVRAGKASGCDGNVVH